MSYAGTTTPRMTPPRTTGPGTAYTQIDTFYAWVYQRGLRRLQERGELPKPKERAR